MEKFQELMEGARKHLNIADHLLLVTYPMVKDPKLLLTVAQNVYKCLVGGMNAVLEHEVLFKRIDILPESFQPRFSVFKEDISPSIGIKTDFVEMISKFRSVVESHEESPVEFARKDKFIISDEDYRVKTLSADSLKQDIKRAKDFLDIVDDIVSENERIFRRS